MPIIIVLLVLILAVLIFGPLAGGVAALAGVLGAAVWLLWVMALPVLMAALCMLGGIGWVIWWCFDPKGAGASLREYEQQKLQRVRYENAVRAAQRRVRR